MFNRKWTDCSRSQRRTFTRSPPARHARFSKQLIMSKSSTNVVMILVIFYSWQTLSNRHRHRARWVFTSAFRSEMFTFIAGNRIFLPFDVYMHNLCSIRVAGVYSLSIWRQSLRTATLIGDQVSRSVCKLERKLVFFFIERVTSWPVFPQRF